MNESPRIEALDRTRHATDRFSSGAPELDRLSIYATQSAQRRVARTYVACLPSEEVVGYYTLVAGQIEHDAATPAVRASVSRHFPIPVCLIARVAVDMSWQRRGLGRDLLRDALGRALAASDQVGMRAAVVDAINTDAASFYRHHGFESVTDDGLTLMTPLLARAPRR